MYIDPIEIKGTKFIVDKKDCNAVQKALFDCGYGYLVGLSLDKKTRKSFIDSSLLSEVDLNKKYVYFPLAVDLERNLLIDAPFYTNQIEIIRSVVKSLPVGYSLYVKENPAQVSREWRDINEYKEIMNIPNTYLIHPSYPSEKLLEKCGLVITIAGTSALKQLFIINLH